MPRIPRSAVPKRLNDPGNYSGVVTYLEPDILECEVKWRSITINKASGGDEISTELFKILEYNAIKVLCTVSQYIWKTQQWLQDWKWLVFILIPKKGSTKEYSNYFAVALSSHASKFMLIMLQCRLQQFMN